MLAVLALGLGVVAGLAAGGSLARVSALRLRGEAAIVVAFIVQGLARGRFVGTGATPVATAVWIASSAALVFLLGLNLDKSGAAVAACGTLINAVVVLVNGAMPVLPSTAFHVQDANVAAASGGFYRVANLGTVAPWAGDALNLAVFGQRYYVSVGDIMLTVGVAVMLAAAMIGQWDRIPKCEPSRPIGR